MIESKRNVPKIYNKSRDFKALMKLLDIVTCVNKSDNDNMVSLINPDRCPDKYLPLLASYVGYNYDYNLPYDTNRNIIKYFPNLVRLRGSEAGIKLAVAVAINSSDSRYSIQSSSELVNINYNPDTGRIMIYIYFTNYLSKLNDLLDVVRPAGLNCVVVDSNAVRKSDVVEISDIFESEPMSYDITSYRYKVTDSNNTSTISLVIPKLSTETITSGTFNMRVPIFFPYTYTYTEEDGSTVSVTDNILKYIVVTDSSGSLVCNESESFSLSIGMKPFPSPVNNAFVNAFNSGTINYNTGELTLSLHSSPSDGIGDIISVNDATMTYTVTGGVVRNSKIRNEIGFGQIDEF